MEQNLNIRSDAKAHQQGGDHEINCLVPMCGGKQTPHCRDGKHLVAAECQCRVISTHFHESSGHIHTASYWLLLTEIHCSVRTHFPSQPQQISPPDFSHYVLSHHCTEFFSFFIVHTSPNIYLLVKPLSPSPHILD